MINIDARNSKPIYEQIIDSIKENVVRGIFAPGDRIPSIRELSKLITANPNTVSKAYLELERQKVIETVPGRGTFISARYKPSADEDRLYSVKTKLKGIAVEAHYLGLDKEGVKGMLEEIYKEIERK